MLFNADCCCVSSLSLTVSKRPTADTQQYNLLLHKLQFLLITGTPPIACQILSLQLYKFTAPCIQWEYFQACPCTDAVSSNPPAARGRPTPSTRPHIGNTWFHSHDQSMRGKAAQTERMSPDWSLSTWGPSLGLGWGESKESETI